MISVCIPTYNGEKYIKEQIASILCQLDADDEIVISDDMSTDETINILKSYNDNRIKIHIHQKEPNAYKGVFKTLYLINRNINNALKYAQGDYIFIADQDDIWMPNKVAVVMEELKNGYHCIMHDCKRINQDMTITEESRFARRHISNNRLLSIIAPCFMGCCMAFKRSVLHLAYPLPSISVEHDTWFGLCALNIGEIKFIKEPLLLYRRHDSNASQDAKNNTNSIYTKIRRRVYILYVYLHFILLK